MAERDKYVKIPGRMTSAAVERQVCGADEVMDDELQKRQSELNRLLGVNVVQLTGDIVVEPVVAAATPQQSGQGHQSGAAADQSGQVDVLYVNDTGATRTVTVRAGQGVRTPDGQDVVLHVAAGGYGELSFLTVGGLVFVRGC